MKMLIKLLPLVKAAHDSMKSSFERMIENIDDSIYSTYMGGNVGGGVPTTGNVSDKVGNIAIRRTQNAISLDTKQLQPDINLLFDVISSTDNGFKILTTIQRVILNIRYTNGEERAWKEVALELKKKDLLYSVSHTRRIHDYAIKCMIMAAQITVDTYNEVMEIIEGRG